MKISQIIFTVAITFFIINGCVETTEKNDATEGTEVSSNENTVVSNPLNVIY